MSRSDSDGARIRAVFYQRVGSGVSRDQDVAVLRQAARIVELQQRLNLKVVGVYTDFAVTRSTPWPARPRPAGSPGNWPSRRCAPRWSSSRTRTTLSARTTSPPP
ncbi:hypothetical protein ACFQ9X_31005 [Catenulispora yoronensis]